MTELTREQVEKIVTKLDSVYVWKHELQYLLVTDAALRAKLKSAQKKATDLRAQLTAMTAKYDADQNTGQMMLDDALRQLTAATTRLQAMEEAMSKGEIWSLFRRLLSQGGDIQMDYNAGKYPSYEHYSARLDGAARERADEFIKALIPPPAVQGNESNITKET